MTKEQSDLSHLKAENKRLRMERDILKKATVFFDSAHPCASPFHLRECSLSDD